MPKRKQCDGDNAVPLPIQLFLWRQTNPFIKGQHGVQCDSSCVSFERVIVQNILHGLSPSLCEALENVSRWKLIQAAFPHVLHCCMALLTNRKNECPDATFSSNETKLLYTLHWIVLDAAGECEDMAREGTSQWGSTSGKNYLFNLDVIQLFVYLIGPLIESVSEDNFQTLKLENGLHLWQPLWEYRQPEVTCFTTAVKPRRNIVRAQRNVVRFNTANIYIGKGTSVDDIYLGFDRPPEDNDDDDDDDKAKLAKEQDDTNGESSSLSQHAPLAHMSDICALSTTTCSESTAIEILCEVCGQVMRNQNGEMACSCGERQEAARAEEPLAADEAALLPRADSPVDKDYIARRIGSTIASGQQQIQGTPSQDVLTASYFDVAVLRCLFSPCWAEQGVYWALRYMHQRLLEICEDMQMVEVIRERSQSLPNPEIDIFPDHQIPTTPSSPRIEMETGPFQNVTEHRKEPAFKRMKVTEFKHMLEGKVKQFRHRDGSDPIEGEHHSTSGRSSPDMSRGGTGLSKLHEIEEDSSNEDIEESCESLVDDLARRKSLPSMKRFAIRRLGIGDRESDGQGRDILQRGMSLKPEMLQRPIITITADSSHEAHLSPRWDRSKRASTFSQRSNVSDKSQHSAKEQKLHGMTRSMTDSGIAYHSAEEVEEVTGSVHFIQRNGQLRYDVILKATHKIASKECSARVCGVLLNVLNCLLDLGVIEAQEKRKKYRLRRCVDTTA